MLVTSLPPLPTSAQQAFTPPILTLSGFLNQTEGPQNFMELVTTIGKSTRDSLKRMEMLSKAAAAGEADPQQVALQVVNTKTAVHQLTVLMNASLQAYQEIMRTGV